MAEEVKTAAAEGESGSKNFIDAFIEEDIAEGGRFQGQQVHTRFPPEPNGYLHIGHCKALTIDFGTAERFGGLCNLRMDDTNPTKEDVEFVDAIKEDIHWLGFDWGDRFFYGSDYFEKDYEYAVELIKKGLAYVCDLTPEQAREYRGDIGKPAVYREDACGGHFPGHAKVSVELAQAAMERLRYDRDTTARVLALVREHDIPLPTQEKGVRRLMMRFDDADIARLLEIQRCDRLAHHPDFRDLPREWYALPATVEKLRAERACLSLRDLAVNGRDLMALGIPAGREVGRILQELLDAVVDGNLENEKETLLAEAEIRKKEKV